MKTTNLQIAGVFNEIAELLDIEGANRFRIRAYRNAARMLLSYPKEMHTLVEEGFDLSSLPTIGKDLAQKITELVRTGKLEFLDDLTSRISPGLEELLRLPGLGPKRIQLLHDLLGIASATDLKEALENGKVAQIDGFGPKTIQTIRDALNQKLSAKTRYRLDLIHPVAERIAAALQNVPGLRRLEIAGSIRRRRDTAKDIDLVAACDDPALVMERLVSLEEVQSVIMQGSARTSVILRNGMHVDLRSVRESEFATALHHFTGSREHNIALRTMASKAGLKINEYGIFKEEIPFAVKSEAELYAALEMHFIVPELRENRGEIEAALAGNLPDLIDTSDIRGDLHVHSAYSDGHHSIEEMALAARARGYEYLAITDHTQHLRIAHGLDEARLLRQLAEIDELNATLEGIRILKSAEVDILSDGSLDLPDTVLRQLDFVVCAVHYRFNLSAAEQTRRILNAMDNPYFSILAHPSGRLIGLRDPYPLDMEAIIRKCSEKGIVLELNAQPDRLDLNDVHCRMAKEAGVKIALSTDAHTIHDFSLIDYGIGQARRGWLEPSDVINTLPLDQLLALLKKRA